MAAGNRGPWTVEMHRLLRKGPMRFDRLVVRAAKAVPPAHAAAFYQKELKFGRKKSRHGGKRFPRAETTPVEERIRYAAGQITRRSLERQILTGYLYDYRNGDGTRWVRLPNEEEAAALEEKQRQIAQIRSARSTATRLAKGRTANAASAKKGWETRRENNADVGAAARKGWETRRKKRRKRSAT